MNRKGFTLIELIVTIALMGIVFSIAIPRLNLDFGKLDSIANELVYDIRYVRQENMKGNEDYRIEFKGEHSYEVFRGLNKIKDVSYPDEYRFVLSKTNSSIDFSVNGSRANGSISTVTVMKMNRKTKGSTVKEIYINDFGAITVTEKKADNEK